MEMTWPLVSANPHFVRIFGLRSDADAVGRNCRFTQGPRTQIYLIEELSSALRGALSCVVRILNYAAEGRCFHTLVVLHPVFETVGGAFRFSLGLQVRNRNRRGRHKHGRSWFRCSCRLRLVTSQQRQGQTHRFEWWDPIAIVQRSKYI